jgi:hypothetical protein
MPPAAAEVIRANLEWSTSAALVSQIQALYPNVSGKQVHATWSKMSETLWKREDLQLPSAKTLLKDFEDDVDTADGVEQLCWGMKKIASRLKGSIVEVGIDATCKSMLRKAKTWLGINKQHADNTNSRNLELYSILGEYDNAGFLLSYCLLSTATAIEVRKQRKALALWAERVRDQYGIYPVFTHVDKDMAEITSSSIYWRIILYHPGFSGQIDWLIDWFIN